MGRRTLRKKRLIVPLRPGEHKAIMDWAERQGVPAAVMTRKMLLEVAEKTKGEEEPD
jgi:hypothetical protein